ncbi:hypothetical protein A7981_08405 [Methylovorus sp. MM2]|nr:hypothetical protein A7981_08405 [Methylovorus sp. MM2]
MICGVFDTFISAFAANLCTVFADQVNKFAFSLHKPNRHPTELGTICIKRDAALHHGRVSFTTASICANL